MNLLVTINDLTVEARDIHPVERTEAVAALADLINRLRQHDNDGDA